MNHSALRRAVLAAPFTLAFALAWASTGPERVDKFRQLDEALPTPNAYRTASGAPGHEYWQQRVDYEIDVELDEETRRLTGSETIHYTNASPDTLRYLWVQLDANVFSPESHAVATSLAPNMERASLRSVERMLARRDFDGGVEVASVRDERGSPLAHTIVDTMMRVDLPRPLASGATARFSIDWSYVVNDSSKVGGRTGAEYFEDDDNWLFEIAQWFPRMAAYTDANGWQHKAYLGRGEFTLEFGDYLVRITVPDDHVVAATGVLQNPDDVLRPEWRERLREAESADEPVFVVTPEEAEANESSEPTGTRTWVFAARDVRDFAFASSRKFIWDAKLHRAGGSETLCMSYWPKEGEPLWSRYSTHAIMHTIDVYSKYTFPYPYPVAISVNGPVGGMEYPMICFNGPRPEEDGTYSQRTKYGLISVIIHEVGHNWFPMIVNSDERQWTWMDEGLNTFLQYLTEQEWESRYPSRRGEPQNITSYMSSSYAVPIMTSAESLLQSGNNGYAKPATALNVLRESVLGRELFDFAFREYALRWRFKRPQPADFFRTIEDASGTDLDWFWRGWFYTTEPVDVAIGGVRRYRIDDGDPTEAEARERAEREAEPETLSAARNRDLPKRLDAFPELADFYNEYDDLAVSPDEVRKFEKRMAELDEDERAILASELSFYVVDLVNHGGLVTPVVLEMVWTDGTTEEVRVPAEVWRRNAEEVSKLVVSEKTLERVVLDPHLETADVDLSNNRWPPELETEHVTLSPSRGRGTNPMQEAAAREEKAAKERAAEAAEAAEAGAAEAGSDVGAGEPAAREGAAPVEPPTSGEGDGRRDGR